MTAVRSYLTAQWALILQAIGIAFSWVMAQFKVPEPETAGVAAAPVSAPIPSVPRAALPPSPTPACEVCGDASYGLRTHDGHWRCLAHKGVTCDVCGRLPIEAQLPDQPWRCASHG